MRLRSALPVLVLLVSAKAVLADAIPYGNGGHVAPSTNLQATATGDIVGYFVASAAGGTDYVRLDDITSGYMSPFLLDNHTTAPGSSVDFGPVAAGDTLVFELVNSDVETTQGYTNFTTLGPIEPNARVNQYLMSSDASYSVDGISHAYVTSFSGDATHGIPAGTYLGMEDLPLAKSDLDYNDTEFVFTNVSASAVTPEPSSLWLLGTGAAGLLGVGRRRFAAP